MVLQEIGLPPHGPTFPLSWAVLEGARRIVVDAPVTVLVGENGTGKGPRLEAPAYASKLPVAASAPSAKRGAQFVIATHSPILMAFPAVRLYELRGRAIVPFSCDELEPVQAPRRFLEAPDAFLRRL